MWDVLSRICVGSVWCFEVVGEYVRGVISCMVIGWYVVDVGSKVVLIGG